MINYELAKKLKEAGYPQEATWYYVGESKELETEDHWLTVDWEWGDCREWCDVDHLACPTLSELIEACNERLLSLDFDTHMPKMKWSAISVQHEERGKTPEEAVAKLYLALNKKA